MFRKPPQLITVESIRDAVSRKPVVVTSKPKVSEKIVSKEEVPVAVAPPLTFRKQEDKQSKVDDAPTEKSFRGDNILWIQ